MFQFQNLLQSTVIKKAGHWHKNGHTEQRNRINGTKITPYGYHQSILTKTVRRLKTNVFNKCPRTAGYTHAKE